MVNAAILIELSIILVIEYKAAKEKRTQAKENLNHKIRAVLIRHGGKMSGSGISQYLEISHETIAERLVEMERKKLIYRKGDDDEIVYIKTNH